MIRIVESTAAAGLLRRRAARLNEAEQIVRPILEDVRKRGDKALMEYARRFDHLTRTSVAIPQTELDAAAGRLSPQFRRAVRTSVKNVRAFARLQLPAAKKHRARARA